MKRIIRLLIMAIIAVLAGVISLYLANGYIGSLTDDSAKATVAAGEITLFGLIFSAFYKEVNSYYSERATNAGKKWDLIFPMLKAHYFPWVHIAGSLKGALDLIDLKSPKKDSVIRYLYLTLVFYGLHMRFTIEDGGLILLSSTRDEDAVEADYTNLQKALNWAADDTPRRVSYLQGLWINKTKSGNPYLLNDFRSELELDNELKDDLEVLTRWLTGNEGYRNNADTALSTFIRDFNKSLDKLYNAWSGE